MERPAPRTRAGLETVLGISLSELRNQTEIRLPSVIHQATVSAVEQTKGDYRERAIDFIVDKGTIVSRRQQTGSLPKVMGGGILASIGGPIIIGQIRDLGKKFGIRPIEVDFHTHPFVPADYIETAWRDRVRRGWENPQNVINSEAIAKRMEIAKGFSENDLYTFELFAKNTGSILLGTATGYYWVINPDTSSVFQRHDALEKYREQYHSVYTELKQATQNGEHFDRTRFEARFDQLLVDYCNERGLVAFKNDDFRSSVLKRMQ